MYGRLRNFSQAHLAADLHGLGEGFCAGRDDEELLEDGFGRILALATEVPNIFVHLV
jgi:hypothetical protein